MILCGWEGKLLAWHSVLAATASGACVYMIDVTDYEPKIITSE